MPDHDESLTRARLITRNVAYNFGSQSWFLVLSLVTTPYVVHELGVEVFGLFTLVTALMGYFAFLDLGLGVATVKYLSEYHGREDDEAVGKVVGTSISAYLLLGAVGSAAIALLAAFLVDRVIDMPVALTDLARTALLIAAVGFLVNMPLSVFSAIPNALQRMDLANQRNIVFGTASVGATVLLLALGYGLVEIVAVTAVISALAAVSFFLLAKRLLPSVSFLPRFDHTTFRLLAGFGSLKFANQMATQTVYHLDKFLVGALASVAAVTYYAIPATIAQRLTGVVANISAAYLPAASDFHGREDRRRFEELYFRSTKLVAILVFPAGSLLFVFAEPILRLWLGADFARESAGVLRVLALGYVVNALSTIPAIACDSVGRPRVTTAFSLASGLLNVALSVALIPPFGILGASFAILVNSLLLVPLFIYYVHRKVVGLSLAELGRRSLLRPFAAMLVSWLPMLALTRVTEGLGLLVVALIAGFAAYVALTVVLHVYDAIDRQLARSYFGRLIPRAY